MKKTIGTLALMLVSAGALITPAMAADRDDFRPAPIVRREVVVRREVRPVRAEHAWYDFGAYFNRGYR